MNASCMIAPARRASSRKTSSEASMGAQLFAGPAAIRQSARIPEEYN